MAFWELVTGKKTLEELIEADKPVNVVDPARPVDDDSQVEQFLSSPTHPHDNGPFCFAYGRRKKTQ